MNLRPTRQWLTGSAAAIAAVAVAFAVVVSSCSDDGDAYALPGTGTEVTMARANWNTGYFQAQLYATLLERLGYDVNDPAEFEMGTDELFEAAALGTVDFTPNGWFPSTQMTVPLASGGTVGDQVTPVGDEMTSGAIQGILIDTASADARGVTELSQIADDPSLARLYDVDGNGMADIFGCPEPWSCDDIIDEVIASVGGDDTIEQIKGDYAENFTQFKRRVLAGEPALAYTWTPNFTVALLRPGKEVKWLSVGQRDSDSVEVQLTEQQCTATPCITGWEPSDIRVVANNDFLEREPAAHALFEAVRIPATDVYAQNLEMDRGKNSPEDIQAAVDHWIQNNRALVVDWLAYARSRA